MGIMGDRESLSKCLNISFLFQSCLGVNLMHGLDETFPSEGVGV
jgi:hypothetical protein